jgi:SAM-dependent methyltransferase
MTPSDSLQAATTADACAAAPQRGRWPKQFVPLTAQQEAIRDDFVKHWLELLPRRYAALERFNHGYPLRTWPEAGVVSFGRRLRTLEVGPGIGAHIGYENLEAQEYHVLEMRENVLNVLKCRYPSVHTGLGSIEERTAFVDGHFDRVIAVHVLEHLQNLPAALREVRRVLSPGGAFSVVLPCEGGFAYSLARRLSAQRMFEKAYRTAYQPFIEREHVNSYAEVLEELDSTFQITHEQRWPLPRVPIAVNLVVGLTLTAR